MSSHGIFCTVFDCMDGRCKAVVHAWCQKTFGVDFPDTITIAGLDGVIIADAKERERAFTMARISAEKHGATSAVVVGHSECAGHPVSDEEHHVSVAEATRLVAETAIFQNVVGLFVDVRTGQIVEVCRW